MTMIRSRVLALLAILLAFPVSAQDTTATELEPVVVSASKAPPGTAPIAQGVSVITGAELRAAGVERVSEALRLVPGAAVVGGGAVGAVTSLFLRGGESRYTKVLIDGVAVNSVGGYFDFSHLTTDNVERIEIVRGPGSVVHGADAMTGVVHIFTRRGNDAPRIEADVRGGTYGTLNGSAALIGASDQLEYSVAGARYTTDGILPFNNEYSNATLSGSVRFMPASATRIDLSARRGFARYHYPTDFLGFVEDSNSFRDQRRLTVGLDAAHRLSDQVEFRLIAGSNGVTDLTDDIEPPPPWIESQDDVHTKFRTRTSRRSSELRATFYLPRGGAITSGVEYVRETERTLATEGPVGGVSSPTSSFAGTRGTRVGFAELSGDAGRLDYTVSGRVDRPSDFGSFATYRVGLGSRWGGVRLRASAGTAFNAPAFSQLLPTEFTVGSPDLDPERVRAVEVGIDWSFARERLRLGLTRFDQRFLDLIQFVNGGPPDFLGSYANLAEARSRGWEVDVRAVPVTGWVLTGSFTQLNARVSRLDERYDGSLEVGQRLIRRSSRAASGALAFVGWDRGRVGLAMRHVGRRPDLDFRAFPSPVVQLPAYTVTDLWGSIRLLRTSGGGGLSLTARVENLFGKDYEEILYYGAPGRTVLIGGRAEVPLP